MRKNSGRFSVKELVEHKWVERGIFAAVLVCVGIEAILYLTPLSEVFSSVYLLGNEWLLFLSVALQCVELVLLNLLIHAEEPADGDSRFEGFCLGLLLNGLAFLLATALSVPFGFLATFAPLFFGARVFPEYLLRLAGGFFEGCYCFETIAAIQFDTFIHDVDDPLLLVVRVAALCAAAALSATIYSALKPGDLSFQGIREEMLLESLSPRQREVVSALMAGKTVKQLSEQLGITPGAVGEYRRRALQKLELDSLEVLAAQDLDSGDREAQRKVMRVKRALWCLPALGLWLFSLTAGWATVQTLRIVMLASAVLVTLGVVRNRSCGICCDWPSLSLLLLLWLAMPLGDKNLGVFTLGCLFCNVLSSIASDVAPADHRGEGLVVVSWLMLLAWKVDYADWQLWVISAGLAAVVLCRLGIALVNRGRVCAIDKDDEAFLKAYLVSRGLSELQATIAIRCSEGRPGKAICQELMVSPGTVNSYRTAVYRRLGVSNRAELRDLFDKVRGKSLY